MCHIACQWANVPDEGGADGGGVKGEEPVTVNLWKYETSGCISGDFWVMWRHVCVDQTGILSQNQAETQSCHKYKLIKWLIKYNHNENGF